MEFLLGGIAATGVAGVVALGIYLAKMAGANRSDLRRLVQSEKDLSDAQRESDGYKQGVIERDTTIESLREQLGREHGALQAARDALDRTTKKLASRGDAASVAADIDSTLKLLSKMSAAGATEAGESSDD